MPNNVDIYTGKTYALNTHRIIVKRVYKIKRLSAYVYRHWCFIYVNVYIYIYIYIYTLCVCVYIYICLRVCVIISTFIQVSISLGTAFFKHIIYTS